MSKVHPRKRLRRSEKRSLNSVPGKLNQLGMSMFKCRDRADAPVSARAALLGIALLAALPLAVACGSGGSAGLKDDSPTSSSMVGKSAPGFTLPSASGEDISLSDYRGKKPVLLYFSMGPG